MTKTLFDSLNVGSFQTENRIFMAPMTRGRAKPDGTPTDIMPTYYRQRSAAGLIITEGTFVSKQGVGWVNAPGIFTDEHEAAWKPVTDAVHAEGGRIFCQLWHMGRVTHPDFENGQPVGPSAIAAQGKTHTPSGKKDYVEPRALDADELPGIFNDYRQAGARAIAAGFDGIEIHGANGYLVDQFIRDGPNQRSDSYGGSIENRWRFPLEIVSALVSEIGADKTSIRLSPSNPYNTMHDSTPVETYSYGAEELAKHGLAYVHLVEARAGMLHNGEAPVVHPHMRKRLGTTPLILNGGYDLVSGNAAIDEGLCDAVSYGATFLANPDLVARFQANSSEFNKPDFATLYSPGEKGYTDYPTL
jgi:N-ethylmaleimide reductase